MSLTIVRMSTPQEKNKSDIVLKALISDCLDISWLLRCFCTSPFLHWRPHSASLEFDYRTSPQSQAVVVREIGGPEQLNFEDNFPTPTMGPGQVIVKNTYAGINFIDTYHRNGLYERNLPFVAGEEGGGFVAAVSTEAAGEGIEVGDRVVYGEQYGSYAEYTAVPSKRIVRVPPGVGMDVATVCMVQGLTAHYLATSAHAGLIKPGEWCLIYSVGSGAGHLTAQMAKLRGFSVIGTCSRGKEDEARSAGCDELIVLDKVSGKSYADYQSVDIVAKVMEVTGGHGVKCVIDGVGRSTVDISVSSLDRRGVFVSMGCSSGPVPDFALLRLAENSAYVTRPRLKDYVVSREEVTERADEVLGWLKDGKLHIRIDKVFPLEEPSEAHVYLESGRSTGKLLYKL